MSGRPAATRRIVVAAPGFAGFGLLLLAWVVLSYSRFIGPTLLATPGEVWDTVLRAFAADARPSERFHIHAWATITRALQGWGLAVLWGLIIGVVIGSRRAVYRVNEPIMEFVRAIPPILAFPVLLVAFNYDVGAYIWTIIFGCLPVMTLSVARGTLSLSRDRLDVLAVYDVAWRKRLPAIGMEILPSGFLGARLAFSFAMIIAVVTEMVFTPRSGLALGALARDAEIEFNTPVFYACVVTIGVFGYVGNVVLRFAEEHVGHQHDSDAR